MARSIGGFFIPPLIPGQFGMWYFGIGSGGGPDSLAGPSNVGNPPFDGGFGSGIGGISDITSDPGTSGGPQVPPPGETSSIVRRGIETYLKQIVTTGKIWYVDSTTGGDSTLSYKKGDDSVHGDTAEHPFATVAYALIDSRILASRGDVIFVLPGHTETIDAAGEWTFADAGVQIVGLGSGNSRPLITFTTPATASILVSAANCGIRNIRFDMTGVDGLDNPINVQAAHFSFIGNDVEFADAAGQADLVILTDANADNLAVVGNDFHGSANAGTATCIRLVGCDSPFIAGNRIVGDFTDTIGGIQALTTAPTNIQIANNFIENRTAASTVCIDLLAGTTGVVRDNDLRVTTDGGVGHIDTPGNISGFRNYGVNNNGETGIQVLTPSV